MFIKRVICLCILTSVIFLVTSCDPLIKVSGNVTDDTPEKVALGQVSSSKKIGLDGVKVRLRPKENPEVGFKAITNENGAYIVAGIITAVKKGWSWSKGWELVFEKDGFERLVVELDPEKHKDRHGKMKWQYRVDVTMIPTK